MDNSLVPVTEQREITPAVWGMIRQIVETTSTSQLARAGIAQKMLFCYENGLPLNLAFNGGLYTVKDRVEVEGNVIRAQLRKHPHYDYEIIELNEKGCTLAITKDGKEIGRASFTEEDAKRAKLLSKENWQLYAPDMYLNRATSRAYKRFAPDIFFTPVYVRGEIEGNDIPDDSLAGDYQIVQMHKSNGNGIKEKLDQLIALYGHNAILVANEGVIPGTEKEIDEIAAKLEVSNG